MVADTYKRLYFFKYVKKLSKNVMYHTIHFILHKQKEPFDLNMIFVVC